MKKSKLTGWKHVFSFTFEQTAKSKSFLSSTIMLGAILFLIMIGINVFSADSDQSSTPDLMEGSEITQYEQSSKMDFAHTIYVKDESGLDLSIEEMQTFVNQIYNSITFATAEKEQEDIVEEMEAWDGDTAYLYLGLGETGMEVELYLPQNSFYQEIDAESFNSCIAQYIESWKDSYLSLTQEQANFLSTNISTSVVTSEDKSITETLVEMYVPMMLCLILYMCIILYGQMVGTSVATEKSSKVMELLLTSVRPLAIIVGKVLSMMALSLLQISALILLILGGNGLGTMLAQKINPDYSNIVVDVLKDFDLLSMFSPVRILLALLVFVLGFTFYCTLAGLMGATVNRGEDLSSAMSVYSTVSVIGFMFAYLPSVLGSAGTGIQTFAVIFPLSSPFILPAKILTGELSNGMIALGILLLMLLVAAFVLVVAKVYEMVILYSGNKIGLKEMRQMLKSQNA